VTVGEEQAVTLRRIQARVAPVAPDTPPETDRRSQWLAILPLCAFVFAVALFAGSSPYVLKDFPIDDAWIHQVYARSFAAGHGFQYNDGAQEAGFTSPLWVVVTAPAHWLTPLGGIPAVVLGVKGIGVLLGGLSVLLCYAIARFLTGSHVSAAIAGLFLALEPRLIFAAFSGMETVLLFALWMGVAWATLQRRYFLALVCLGWMPVARPESVVVMPLVLVGIAAAGGSCDGVWRRPSSWLWLGLPSVAWAAFCLMVNGRLLPNTFYGKAAPYSVGPELAGVAWRSLVQQGWGAEPWLWLGLVSFGGWLTLRRGRDSLFIGAILVLAPLLYVFGVLGSRFYSLEGYYWTRWVDPAVLVLTSALAMGLAVLLRVRLRRRALATLVAVAVGVAILASLPRWAASFDERLERLASDSRAVHLIEIEPALWIRDNTAPDAVVGVVDAGAIRFFGQRKTIDLMGLNDADIAMKRIDRRQAARQLDWLVAFPFWLDASGLADQFAPHRVFRIPEEEYTVCPCPQQATVVISRRATVAASLLIR